MIQQLRDEIARLEQENDDLKDELTTNCESYERELDGLAIELERTRAKLDAADERIEDMTFELGDLRTELDEGFDAANFFKSAGPLLNAIFYKYEQAKSAPRWLELQLKEEIYTHFVDLANQLREHDTDNHLGLDANAHVSQLSISEVSNG